MAVTVTTDQVEGLAPGIQAPYRAAFERGQPLLDFYGISATPLRVAHFVAQTLHETGAYRLLAENLDYSAARLVVVWPTRFQPKGALDPALYAHQPELLADAVYGGRLGNLEAGDGYAYRGRGLLQLTGRASYAEATWRLRQDGADAPDFVVEPDAVAGAVWCLAVAAVVWAAKGGNALADQDDVRAVTRRINGGDTGLAERIEWTRRARLVWRQA
jgi:putative chitinase